MKTAHSANYQKYRWFFTSDGKLVIGGKNAEQNEIILSSVNSEDIIMHTASPGSPFCILKIGSNSKIKPSAKDLQEIAIFCACFSQDWKRGKQQSEIHVFTGEQIYKSKNMKKGTFGVMGKISKRAVKLKLYFAKQKGKLRAVPFKTKITVAITPGNTSKEKTAEILANELKTSKDEVMQALPAGGFSLKIK